MEPKRLEVGGSVHVLERADSWAMDEWPGGDTLFFDPPWDQMRRPPDRSSYASVLAFCDGQRAGDVVSIFGPPSWVFVWDCCSSWHVPNRPLKRAKMCFAYFDEWLGDEHVFIQKRNAQRVAFNTRGAFLAGDDRGTRITDVYQNPITQLHKTGHNHGKPLEWIRYLVAGVTPEGGTVVDPFAGGLVAASAASMHGINSHSIEIEEVSWQEFESALCGPAERYPDQRLLI